MESKNLVICDPETKFASAFAQYLTRQKELAVRVRTCSDLSYVLAIQEKEKIDFLFISSEYPEDSRKQWMKKCREDKMRMKRSIGRFTGITIDDEFLMGKLILDIEKYHAWRKKGGKGFLKTAENF